MATDIKIDLDSAEVIIARHGLAPGGEVQKFVTSELLRLSDPYTPMDSSMLKSVGTPEDNYTFIGYDTPYARYMWYGKLMVDPITKKGAFFSPTYGFWSRAGIQKELTDIDLKYQGAPLRGPKWVERAYIDNKDTFLRSVERLANKGG